MHSVGVGWHCVISAAAIVVGQPSTNGHAVGDCVIGPTAAAASAAGAAPSSGLGPCCGNCGHGVHAVGTTWQRVICGGHCVGCGHCV